MNFVIQIQGNPMPLDPAKLDALDTALLNAHSAIGGAKATAAAKSQAQSAVDDATAALTDASGKDATAQQAVIDAVGAVTSAFQAATGATS